jgi:hypothetical protein
MPRSRRNPQFNRDTLPEPLRQAGIKYLELPGLGGLRGRRPDSPNGGWQNASFQGYADYLLTPEFERALQVLVEHASSERAALLCAEAVPWRCHRSLIADALLVRGIPVEHILDEKRTQPHVLRPFARVEGTFQPDPSGFLEPHPSDEEVYKRLGDLLEKKVVPFGKSRLPDRELYPLEKALGARGQAIVQTIRQGGQIVFHAVGDTGPARRLAGCQPAWASTTDCSAPPRAATHGQQGWREPQVAGLQGWRDTTLPPGWHPWPAGSSRRLTGVAWLTLEYCLAVPVEEGRLRAPLRPLRRPGSLVVAQQSLVEALAAVGLVGHEQRSTQNYKRVVPKK